MSQRQVYVSMSRFWGAHCGRLGLSFIADDTENSEPAWQAALRDAIAALTEALIGDKATCCNTHCASFACISQL
jgi:hypothetical protein